MLIIEKTNKSFVKNISSNFKLDNTMKNKKDKMMKWKGLFDKYFYQDIVDMSMHNLLKYSKNNWTFFYLVPFFFKHFDYS